MENTDTFYVMLRPRLEGMADAKYREFHSRLVPGVHDFMGIRLPELRKLGKELAADINAGSCECTWNSVLSEEPRLYEEVMLRGILIGLMPQKAIPEPRDENLFEIVFSHVKYIDNWALCDCFCNGLKQKKLLNETFFANCVNRLILAGDAGVWHIRTGLVLMLSHFINAAYISRVLGACHAAAKRIGDFAYEDTFYVRMGLAWLLAECYVKFREETSSFLFGPDSCENIPDNWTFNKAIQKMTESRFVVAAEKEELKTRKRAKKK